MSFAIQNKSQLGNEQKGSVLPLVLIFGSFFLIIFTSLLFYLYDQRHLSVKKIQREEAFNIAEAGIEMYHWHIIAELDGKTAEEVSTYWNETPLGIPSYEREYKDPQGTAVGKFKLEVTEPEEGSTVINLRSTGWHYNNPEVKRIIEVEFKKPAWSDYAVLANDVMRFGEGTEVWGSIHSNGGIRFDGIAHNLISSSEETYWDPDTFSWHDGVWTSQSDPNQVFLAGVKYPVTETDFGGVTTDLKKMRDDAKAEGVYLPYAGHSKDGYELELKEDDSLDVYIVKTRGSSSHHIYSKSFDQNYPFPSNGLIFVEDDATIKGTLNDAKITIACADLTSGSNHRNIYIENDIKYASYDGTEILGLIAQGSIKVGLYSENDLRIDGALIAQNGNVGRDYYSFFDSFTYYKRDTVTVYGAIATNNRYGFSWLCLGTYCSGYLNRNITYDSELIYNIPPFFPTQNSYSLDSWEEIQ
jgi:hypothetical protein